MPLHGQRNLRTSRSSARKRGRGHAICARATSPLCQVCQIDVTLADDAWVEGLETLEAGEEFVRGLTSVVPQAGGWDGASAGVLSRKSISVHDPSHLSVSVPQMAGFDILSAQEIRLSVPPVAVRSNQVPDCDRNPPA